MKEIQRKEIRIEKIESKVIQIKLKGITEMLMHGRTAEWAEWYEKERDKKKGEKVPLTAEQEANLGVYKDADGKPIIPARTVYRMLRDSFGTLAGSAKGYKRLFDSSVTILPNDIPFKFESRTIDKRAVNIGFKIPDIRHRWKFSNWEIEFTVLLRSTLELDEKRFFTVLNFCGQFVGLMDGRTIGFGRFEIVK